MLLMTEESMRRCKEFNDRFHQLNEEALKAGESEIDVLDETIHGLEQLRQHIVMQAMAEAWKKLVGEEERK